MTDTDPRLDEARELLEADEYAGVLATLAQDRTDAADALRSWAHLGLENADAVHAIARRRLQAGVRTEEEARIAVAAAIAHIGLGESELGSERMVQAYAAHPELIESPGGFSLVYGHLPLQFWVPDRRPPLVRWPRPRGAWELEQVEQGEPDLAHEGAVTLTTSWESEGRLRLDDEGCELAEDGQLVRGSLRRLADRLVLDDGSVVTVSRVGERLVRRTPHQDAELGILAYVYVRRHLELVE